VAHQIYKECSSWFKKADISDSATNAEKRFKGEKNGFSTQNGAKVVPGPG
jgi:hypothetical protein